MNYRTEKQFTSRQRKLIYEEVYFNNNMTIANYDPLTGYQLKFPQFFTANPSQDKSVAPRRVQIIPSSHQFRLNVTFRDAAAQQHGNNVYFLVDILKDNSTQEILSYIRESSICVDNGVTYALRSVYNKITGQLTFQGVDLTNMQQVEFRFSCPSIDDYLQFWFFLNQIGIPFRSLLLNPNQPLAPNCLDFTAEYTLENVWNRDVLYVHTSFSSSQHHYMCLSNEFWEKPSKIFYCNINDNAFYVYYTTDGSQKIVPYHANKLIELSFVLRTQEL